MNKKKNKEEEINGDEKKEGEKEKKMEEGEEQDLDQSGIQKKNQKNNDFGQVHDMQNTIKVRPF